MDSYDLEIYQGATYSLTATIKDSSSVPINLSGYNISGFLKYKYSDTSYLTSLNPTKNEPYASGVITLTIPATGTANLPIAYGFYDVEIHNTGNGVVTKVLRGKASIFPEATY